MPQYPLFDPIPRFWDNSGLPLSGGTVTFYTAGTTTKRAVYTNKEGSEQLANPNTLLSTGQPQNSTGAATPVFGSGKYKVVVADSTGVVLYTADGISILDLSNFAETVLDDTAASAMRTTLGLGTAATVATGTSAGNTIVLDTNARLPAVDGRNLTHILPRSYLAGLTLSNDTDTDHDILVAAGECKDSTNVYDLILSSAIAKQIDATWAVGDDAGGMESGTALSADTTYFVYLIARSDTGVVDAMFSDDVSSPTLPTNYDYFRRIGAVITDSSSNILGFTQRGDEVELNVPVLDVNSEPVSTVRETLTLTTTPNGLSVEAIINVGVDDSAGRTYVWLTALTTTDAAPSATVAPLSTTNSDATDQDNTLIRVWTDTSRGIGVRASTTTATVEVATLGWIDRRGRDD